MLSAAALTMDTALGVCVYVILGGLRATFICDFSHTLILMVIILYFMFNAYATSPLIGSPSAMYDLLQEAAFKRPVAGNTQGSYTTLKSNFALIFGVIQLCSGCGQYSEGTSRSICSRTDTSKGPSFSIKPIGKELSPLDPLQPSEPTSWAALPGSPSRSASAPHLAS